MKTKKGFRLFCIITFIVSCVIINLGCCWCVSSLGQWDYPKIKALFIGANALWVLVGGGFVFLSYNICKQFYK